MELSTIRNMMQVNRHKLDEELELQAYIADQISQQYVRAKAKAEATAEGVKRADAVLYAECRDDTAAKMSEAEIKAYILRHPDHVRAAGTDQAMQTALLEWTCLREDWKTRSFALRELAGLYSSSYFDAGNTSTRQRITGDASRTRLPPGREPAESEEPKPRTRVRATQ